MLITFILNVVGGSNQQSVQQARGKERWARSLHFTL
jgi:hypothetical protein